MPDRNVLPRFDDDDVEPLSLPLALLLLWLLLFARLLLLLSWC